MSKNEQKMNTQSAHYEQKLSKMSKKLVKAVKIAKK